MRERSKSTSSSGASSTGLGVGALAAAAAVAAANAAANNTNAMCNNTNNIGNNTSTATTTTSSAAGNNSNNGSNVDSHTKYLRDFRVEQCPLFIQRKCTQHRPFTCFNWHFMNQRRRRPTRKRDCTFNYSADNYCTKYDETAGICPDGDE